MFFELYFIVAINDLFDVVYTAVADLNGISVKYVPKIVACWETVVDKVEEFFANVSIYIFTERRAVPSDVVSWSVSFVVGFRPFKIEFVVVFTLIQCFLAK